MKFSSSLLGEKEISIKMFNNSITKTKTLLKDIFGLTFDGKDLNIISINEDPEKQNFCCVFTINSREVNANFSYDVDDTNNDIVVEVLYIIENIIEKVYLPEIEIRNNNTIDLYRVNVKNIQDYLENRFELNFTPLDPEEKDKNITSVSYNEDELTWKSVFLQEYKEGCFEVTYEFQDGQEQYINIIHQIKHKIFID